MAERKLGFRILQLLPILGLDWHVKRRRFGADSQLQETALAPRRAIDRVTRITICGTGGRGTRDAGRSPSAI
jgi:hypothetical protein